MNHLSKTLFLMFLTFFLVVESAFALSNIRPVDVATGTADNTDNTGITKGILKSGQQDLQTILDKIVSNGSIDAINDQQTAGRWTHVDGDTDIYAVGMFTSHAGTLGIYGIDKKNKYELFSAAPSDDGKLKTKYVDQDFSITPSGELRIGDSTEFVSGNFSSFGFYWKDSYTEDYLNTDEKAMALSYLVEDGFHINKNAYDNHPKYDAIKFKGGDDWIIAFEDGNTNGDQADDFQDIIIFIEDMTPVPEPASLALLGLGLLGLAGIGRKKLAKK